MDLHELQDALKSLESRYQKLNELLDSRSQAYEQEITDLNQKLVAKEDELQKLVEERDARSEDNAVAHLHLVSIKKQLEEKDEELQKFVKELAVKEKEQATTCKLVEDLNQRLEQTSDSLKQKQSEVDNVSEEAYLTMLQLKQIQEELLHYFYQSRGKHDLLQRYQAQQKRTKELISKMLIKNFT